MTNRLILDTRYLNILLDLSHKVDIPRYVYLLVEGRTRGRKV